MRRLLKNSLRLHALARLSSHTIQCKIVTRTLHSHSINMEKTVTVDLSVYLAPLVILMTVLLIHPFTTGKPVNYLFIFKSFALQMCLSFDAGHISCIYFYGLALTSLGLYFPAIKAYTEVNYCIVQFCWQELAIDLLCLL